MRRIFFFSVVTLGLTGCGSKSPENPSDPMTNGVAATSKKADGQEFNGGDFTITLNKDWVVMDLTNKQFDEAMKEVDKHPELGQFKNLATQLKDNKSVKFFAFEPKFVKDGFGTNLNIIEMPLPSGTSADQLFKANEDQMRPSSDSLNSDRVKLGSAEADHIEWSMKGDSPLAFVTYLAVKGDKQYIFTFTTTKKMLPDAKASFDEAGKTITFK